ncbi:energy transducer TonB [Flavobacterium sp. PLA-1-15]|uniref:energy transducer TonB n=1 Tax=Flavobacterium sp. PLA-1-15 TaxID=3380533 RepID=UPI003B783372
MTKKTTLIAYSLLLPIMLLMLFSCKKEEIRVHENIDAPIKVTEEESVIKSDEEVYTNAETKPQFKGGISEFYNYIGKNYRVPEVEGLNGKVYVQFVIEKDGSLADIKIIRDIGHGTGEEAIRVLKNSPKWIPAKQNGRPVRVLYSLPISIATP